MGVRHRIVTRGHDDTLGPWAWDDVRMPRGLRRLVGRVAQYALATQVRIVKLTNWHSGLRSVA